MKHSSQNLPLNKLAVALAAALGLGSAQAAQTVTYTATVPLAWTDWTQSLSLPQFNPTLGSLLSVDLTVVGGIKVSTGVENKDNKGCPVTTGADAYFSVVDGTGSEISSVMPSVRFTNVLAAYDGVADLGGTSGARNPAQTNSVSSVLSLVAAQADLSTYLGTGNLTYEASAYGWSFYDGPGDYSFLVSTEAQLDLQVTYTYEPVAAIIPLGSLGDRVWFDANRDGLQATDGTEPGLVGWTVTIYNSVGNIVSSQVTVADGTYLFDGLEYGQYTVTVTPPTGVPAYSPTGDLDGYQTTPHTAVAAVGDVNPNRRDVDFGYALVPVAPVPPVLGSIGDRVWKDVDADGVQDANETGLKGWTVQLYRDGLVQATQTTGDNGSYLFPGLVAGSYTVRVTRQAGYAQTFDLDGLNTPDVAVDFDLTAGQDRRDVDFGYVVQSSTLPCGERGTARYWSTSGKGLGFVRLEDLSYLSTLKLVNSAGADVDFLNPISGKCGGSVISVKSQFASFESSTSTVNLANALSRELAAFALNLRFGLIAGDESIAIHKSVRGSGKVTANELLLLANSTLLADSNTRCNDANYTYQSRLKSALASANAAAETCDSGTKTGCNQGSNYGGCNTGKNHANPNTGCGSVGTGGGKSGCHTSSGFGNCKDGGINGGKGGKGGKGGCR